MDSMVSSKRKNDAVIAVCQDNKAHQLKIERVNRAAEKLTGYRQLELVDKSLERLLPESINDLITSYLDYNDISSDLASVLRKVRDFHLRNRKGEEVPVTFKVFYMPDSDAHKLKYEFLMRDMTLLQKVEELKQEMAQFHDGADMIEVETGLLKERAIMEALARIQSFFNQYVVEVSVGVIGVDHLEDLASEYGTTVEEIIRQLSAKAKRIFRTDDIVGCIDHKYICGILFDCSAEDAQKAFTRVKQMVERDPLTIPGAKKPMPVKLSIGYSQIQPNQNPQHVLGKCKNALNKAQDVGGDRIYEVVE